MNYFFCLIFFTFPFFISAQAEKNFRGFGEEVFKNIVLEAKLDTVSMIRLREYRDFIRERVKGENKRNELIHNVNATLLDVDHLHHRGVNNLLNFYKEAQAEGATARFSDTYYFEKENALADTYTFIVKFIFQNGALQTEVSWQFDVVWYLDQFLFISPIEEKF